MDNMRTSGSEGLIDVLKDVRTAVGAEQMEDCNRGIQLHSLASRIVFHE